MMFRISLLFGLIICQLRLWSQVDMGYIKYLSSHKLATEHQQYLLHITPKVQADSLLCLRMKFYLQYRNQQEFTPLRQANNVYFMNDSAALLLTGLWVLEDLYQSRGEPSQWLLGSTFQSAQELGKIMDMGLRPRAYDRMVVLPSDLDEPWQKLHDYSRKKPWKAALLSTVLPGSGKIYAQRSRVAYLGALGLALFGAQAFEAYHKLGIKHPLTIGNMVVFGIFYGGNIYGSAMAVKSRCTELRNKFYKDAAFYYRRLHRPLLY